MKKGDNWKAYLTIGIIILFIATIYFTLFFYYSCNDLECFQGHQKKCVKTKFIRNTEDTIWEYTIKGEQDGKCMINVKILTIRIGTADKQILEGKDMNCFLPLKSTAFPEENLEKCHGVLKEEMQNLIIQKLHSYIVENVGEIGEELGKILE